ncbi:DEAD/DEAH box helicase family protein [Rhodococcus qingshengii]|uniref:DEAD/DEAH box helicase family protein n=1 Tax=Rhodococcus TaxID=1827 RepID=UPI001BAF4B77|nr:DEAD/DEAH box helicase family protein [Rhodococcus qingshengii]MBS3695253.1 DEAD/DEAH box helicase family protein [Rhodococcus qingshengii]
MPSLRSLDLDARYRSDSTDVVTRFYVPAFSAASTYSRAVGYFTSTSLALYARGIDEFVKHGGSMRLIASPHLDEGDIADIEHGYSVRDIVARAAMRELDGVENEKVLAGLGQVGRLIAEGRLDVKLAFVVKNDRVGIYHEKIGIFRDGYGDLVAFTGSSNETLGGLAANFESVEVYRGWTPGDGARALRIESDFNDLWANRTSLLSVEPFPDIARERLIELGHRHNTLPLPGNDDALEFSPLLVDERGHLTVPTALTPRGYQNSAVEAWLRKSGRGFLAMATGTGKTKTALLAATAIGNVLREREQPLVLVVLAPLQHLVDQWIEEVEAFGVTPIPVYESSAQWVPLVEDQIGQARLGQRPVVVLVATNISFASSRFQGILGRLTLPLMVIADEAHNLGSDRYRTTLPPNATYRLGLSATPERWHDEEGTAALFEYFGPIVFELGLAEAIDMGALCRYTYHPRLVELNDEETQLYAELTNKIARCIAAGGHPDDADPDSPLGFLLRKRANVLGHAAGKLTALRADLKSHRDSWFQLVYCAEGRRPSPDGEESGPQQLAEVMRLVGNELGIPAHRYIGETSRTNRKLLLRRFSSGEDLQALVAMRCLDEGVDIPDARLGYLLASSSNPRQFIQRRGRLLRHAAGKTRAVIFDYLAVPKSGSPINFDVERSLLIREIERANEFGKVSENYGKTLDTLRPLRDHYHLMDL